MWLQAVGQTLVPKAGPGTFVCRAHGVLPAFRSLLGKCFLKTSSNATSPGEPSFILSQAT